MNATATATANPTPKLRRLRSNVTGLRPAKRKRNQSRTMPPVVIALDAPRTRSGSGLATNSAGSIEPLNVLPACPRKSARMPSSQGAPPESGASASANCSTTPSATIETSSPAAAREETGRLLLASTRISVYAPIATATISSSDGPPIALAPARSATCIASRARSGCRNSPPAMPNRISWETLRKALRSTPVANERSTANQSSASAARKKNAASGPRQLIAPAPLVAAPCAPVPRGPAAARGRPRPPSPPPPRAAP